MSDTDTQKKRMVEARRRGESGADSRICPERRVILPAIDAPVLPAPDVPGQRPANGFGSWIPVVIVVAVLYWLTT